ncbi:MAG: dihydropteroate synthase [Parachlamydiaceae bacterium]
MKTKIMGILNVTPDSCYDKGRFFAHDKALKRAFEMIEEGADMIDIGGESTRPGAEPVPAEEELRRVIPVIKAIRAQTRIPLSIDTMKPQVAQKALEHGVNLINDVTGFKDPLMIKLAREYQADICVMHMQGTPQTMQLRPHYEEGVLNALNNWFKTRVDTLLNAGINRDKIILDPGIGFGKTVEDNVKILQNVPTLQNLGFPLLLGVSRKSFLSKICGQEREQLLAATLAASLTSVMGGVDYIRVHDVKEHRDLISFLKVYAHDNN